MVGVAVFAGLLSAWWLFPVGIVLWVIMVLLVSRDRALRFNAQMQRREPLAQRFQRHFDRIERAQVSIFNTLSSSSSVLQRVLRPIEIEVNALTEAAYDLCRRMTALENYRLVSQSQTDLAGERAHIDQLIAETGSPELRQDYEASRQALQERLDRLEDVGRQLDRVEAQLLGLIGEMDGVVSEIVRLQAAGLETAEPLVEDVVRHLRLEIEELRAFERQAMHL
jgi:hypothetical protein